MERVSVLCLLLLCSLSGADHMNSGNSEQREARPESVNVPVQTQAGPSDVHAVLRDLTAKLAVLQFRVDQLQTLNQEQAAKLRDVDLMKEKLQVRQVAFSAALATSSGTTLGPSNTPATLIFRHVITNVGNAYNPSTGVFTAPVKGAYHFEVYIHGYPSNTQPSAAMLMKNEETVVSSYAIQSNGAVTPAAGATVILEPSDVVFVRTWRNSRIYDNVNHHTSFSGHLLFPM